MIFGDKQKKMQDIQQLDTLMGRLGVPRSLWNFFPRTVIGLSESGDLLAVFPSDAPYRELWNWRQGAAFIRSFDGVIIRTGVQRNADETFTLTLYAPTPGYDFVNGLMGAIPPEYQQTFQRAR